MFLPSFHGSRKVTSLLPGPYQRPYIAATTFPFRVRGTQVRVVSAKQPEGEEGALVYRIHAEQPGVALPSVDRPLATDPQGYLLGHGEIDVGDRLVALNPITSTNTYTIYATNATPTATGIDAYTVQNPGVQTLTVSSDHTLALFDLAVSLEWDARSDTQFTAQLVADLKRTSELLYNWTKGQTALGNVTIYHDKQHWQDAQVRVYASNQIRPNANKNGIAITGDQVRIGAVWNRYGEANGTLGEDWPRALAHEFGHYAFGLDDNYLGLDAQNRLIPVESCPGVMSNPYRADQSDFRPRADWLPACEATLSNRENQRSDWATIVENYPWLHDPTTGLADMQPGPSALPLAVTQIRFVTPTTPTTTLAAPIFYLTKAEDQSRYVPTAGARAFLFTCSGGACQGQQPSDLIDLGRPTQDQVVARGAQPGDRLCMYDLNAVDTYGQAAPRQGCLAISQGSTRLDLRVTTNWQPEVHITPETTTSVTVAIGNISSTLTLQAQLDPASGVATAPIGLAYDPASKTYQGTFMLATPSVAGDVHIWVDEPEPRREVVADYGLGGNPARRGGGTFAPVLSPDGQVLLYGKDLNFAQGQFYTLQAATHIPAPPAWATVVGQGYWLSAPAQIDLGGASMNFNYLGRDVPPGEEQWVTVYFCPQSCPADGSGWQPLQTTRALATNTAVALVQGSGPGLYTLMSSIEIPLTAGVNYFAYAIQESRPVRQALLSIDSTPTSGRAYTLVRGYDTANQRWLVFDPAKPDNDPANTLKTLQFGQGYEITVNRNVTLRLKGSGLSPGSGASATQAAPALYYGMLAPGALILTHTTEPVLARIDDHICGKGVAWADGQVVRYLITVSADAPSAAGCGAPGRTVTIQLGTHTWTTVWDNKQAHSEQDTKL